MTSTIRDLTELLTVAANDYLLISDTSDVTNRDKRISQVNLIGGALTGGGTLATGGFTLTVPATGTAALLATAQSFSALKTFSAGLSLGNALLSVYDEGTWLPVLTGAGGAPTISYTTQTGSWRRINNWVDYELAITINTMSGGIGVARISLPFVCNSFSVGEMYYSGMDVPGTPVQVTALTSGGAAYMTLQTDEDHLTSVAVPISAFSAGNSIVIKGSFRL